VYLDKDKHVIYVGKAINLKSRVSSYFSSPSQLGEKTRALVSQIENIDITIVESEIEALLLEAYYIKKFNPKYNIRLTDNKQYILVRITNQYQISNVKYQMSNEIKKSDNYPKILLARRADDPASVYFGPFPSSREVKLVLKTIRKVFPFVSVRNHPKRVCLYHHLGLCPCPPVFDSPEMVKDYQKNIKQIIRIFEGSSKKIMKELEAERDKASAEEKFEEALVLQRRIQALGYITQPFHKPFEYDINPNLRSDLRQRELESLKQILKDNGCPVNSLERIECYDISHIQGTNTVASMVVFVDGEKESGQYRKFKLRKAWMEKKVSKVSKVSEVSKGSGNNDFESMKEVLQRRIRHEEWSLPGLIIIDGGKGQVSSAMAVLAEMGLEIPLIGLAKREETIVIPISKNSKFEIRNSKQIQDSNSKESKRLKYSHLEHSVAIVSDFDIRASNLSFIEVSLPHEAKALQLLQRIRDEAHRFAITYHRKLRSKAAID
jgi:excinuclease ABC subunit C